MFTTLAAVIFFSLKKRRAPKDMTYETLLSACYRWATAPKAGNGPRISVVEPKINPRISPALSLQSSSSPATFLWLHCELCKASCKKAGLPSQTSVKRGTEMGTLWVCYSLHMSLVESYPFSEPRNSQLAMQGVEEHDPGMF